MGRVAGVSYALIGLLVALVVAGPAQASVFDTTLVSALAPPGGGGDGDSSVPSTSDDGRYVTFESEAGNLSTADDDSFVNVFVKDLQTGEVKLASRGIGGPANGDSDSSVFSAAYGPEISGNGRYVVFASKATNLVNGDPDAGKPEASRDQDVFRYDRVTDTVVPISPLDDGTLGRAASISDDGSRVTFTKLVTGEWLWDNGTVRQLFPENAQEDEGGFATISGDGQHVAYENHPDVMVGHVDAAKATYLTSYDSSEDIGSSPQISGDGNWVAFNHEHIDAGTTHAERIARTGGATVIASRADGADGELANNDANLFERPAISDDGRHLGFTSFASNLDPADTDGSSDVFVRDLGTNDTALASRASGASGDQANGSSRHVALSGDGLFVAFLSAGTNLSDADVDAVSDVFVRQTAPALPVNTRAPHVAKQVPLPASVTPGDTLVCDRGEWSRATSYAYEWFAAGAPIGGAAGSTYTVGEAEVGKEVHCRVTATGPEGSAVRESDNKLVVEVPPPPPPPPGGDDGGIAGDADPYSDDAPTPASIDPLGPPIGNAAPECTRSVEVGLATAVAECFKKVTARRYASTERVRIAGIDLIPQGGASVEVTDDTLNTTGTVLVRIGSFDVVRTRIDNWKLFGPVVVPWGSGEHVFGLGVKGTARIEFRKGEATIGARVDVPYPFDAGGDLQLRSTNERGLIVESAEIRFPSVYLWPTPMRISNATLRYRRIERGDLWEGGATLETLFPSSIPLPKLDGRIGILNGKFHQAYAGVRDLPSPPVPPPYFAKLDRFGLLFSVLPGGNELRGEGDIRIYNVMWADPMVVRAALTFEPSTPPTFRFAGRATEGPLGGDGFVNVSGRWYTGGFVSFGADWNVENVNGANLPMLGADFLGSVKGWWLKRGQWNLEGRGTVDIPGPIDAEAEALISNKGLAVCRRGIGPHVGLGITFGPSPAGFLDRIKLFGSACDLGPWRTSLAAAQVGPEGKELELPAKLRTVAFEATGDGAPPILRVTAPDGSSFVTPAEIGRTAAGAASIVRYGRTTSVAIDSPAAGTWRIEPAEGSPAITALRVAQPAPAPKVKVAVKRGKGRKRVLSWSFAPSPGRSVRFSEEGASAAGPIVETSKPKGAATFAPADGKAGSRSLVAEVLQDGAPVDKLTVGKYSAPGPDVPARPKVSVSRTASRATLRWKKTRGVAYHLVQVTLSDGRRLSLQVKRTSLAIAAASGVKGSATVRAYGPTGRPSARVKTAVKVYRKPR